MLSILQEILLWLITNFQIVQIPYDLLSIDVGSTIRGLDIEGVQVMWQFWGNLGVGKLKNATTRGDVDKAAIEKIRKSLQ